MTDIFPSFFAGFALSGSLIAAIGAQNLFVLRQGLRREHVGSIILFCAAADAALIASGVAGLGELLKFIPQLTRILTLGGAAFLLLYGAAALRRMIRPDEAVVGQGGAITLREALGTTAAFTFLNPHVYLDTVLLMGAAGSAQPEGSRPLFVAGAALASFTWFTTLGYGARALTPLFERPAAWRVLDGVVAATMFTLASTLILQGAR